MNSDDSSTESNRSRSCSISGAYCALTSTSGIRTARKATGAPAAHDQIDDPDHDRRGDDVVDVVEALVERLPARSECVADPREDDAPDRRPDRGQHRVAQERRTEDAGGDRDERSREGRDPADEHGPVAPAVEPVLGVLDPVGRQVEPPPTALEERTAAVEADRPAEQRPDEVAERPRD